MMEIICDAVWDKCLTDSVKLFRLNEPDDRCYHLANATWAMKNKYQEHANKKDSRKVIVIDKSPEIISEQRTSTKKTCSALTMKGKPCGFKASCGNFCKKHQAKPLKLGTKIDMKKIKIND